MFWWNFFRLTCVKKRTWISFTNCATTAFVSRKQEKSCNWSWGEMSGICYCLLDCMNSDDKCTFLRWKTNRWRDDSSHVILTKILHDAIRRDMALNITSDCCRPFLFEVIVFWNICFHTHANWASLVGPDPMEQLINSKSNYWACVSI